MEKEILERYKKFNTLIRLTDEEQEDPKIVFFDFFDNYHLKDIRAELWEWLWSAMANDTCYYQDPIERSNLIYTYEKIECLIEAAYILFMQNGWYIEEEVVV